MERTLRLVATDIGAQWLVVYRSMAMRQRGERNEAGDSFGHRFGDFNRCRSYHRWRPVLAL
jgi:hypothetical protein